MSQLKPLSDEDKNVILPLVIKVLMRTSDNPTTHLHSDRIVKFINSKRDSGSIITKNPMSDVKLRKIVNWIRMWGLLPLMSGPTGYWITSDDKAITDMIASLESRIASMKSAIEGLKGIQTEKKLAQKNICPLGLEWN